MKMPNKCQLRGRWGTCMIPAPENGIIIKKLKDNGEPDCLNHKNGNCLATGEICHYRLFLGKLILEE